MVEKVVRVWGPAIRVFHWTLVVAFIIAYATGEELETLHRWAGYVIALLCLWRIVWGVVGPRHARFGDFIYSPATILGYARDVLRLRPPRYLGHNPLGGLMVLALLSGLTVTCWSGLELEALEGRGPLAGEVLMATAMADEEEREDEHEREHEGQNGEEWLEELHEFFANFTLFLVLLHVAGVVLDSILHRENLVRSMITGNKRISDETEQQQ